MKRFLAALCATAYFALSIGTARASDRVVVYPAQIPQSTWPNQQARYDRNALGTVLIDALALEAAGSGAGTYADLTVSPGTGLFVTVAPSTSNTFGAIYQVGQSDPNPLPTNAPVTTGVPTPLPPDTHLIAIPAFIDTTSSPLGPLTAPGSNSVYWLVEAEHVTADTGASSATFQNTKGQPFSTTVNLKRQDQIVFQIKAGTPASSPTVPTPDSGFIPIAKILVPTGKTQILTSDITMYPAWTGFLQANTAIVLNPSPSPSPQAGNAAIAGTFSAQTYYGDGSNLTNVNPSFSMCVPQNQGGTGTCSPTGNSSGASTNILVTGSFPNQVIDITQNPVFTGTANVGALNTTAGVTQAGTNNSGFVAFGQTGTASSDVVRFGNAAVATMGYTSIGASNSGSVTGVSNSVLSLGNTGTKVLAVDNAGDLGVLGSVNANSGSFTTALAVNSVSGVSASFTGAVSGSTLATTSLVSQPCVGTNSLGVLVSNASCSGSGVGVFSGGIGLDGTGGPPANGITCGVANTTKCLFLASMGTTTTEGYSFDTATACHASTDVLVNLKVNASSKATFDCSGDLSAAAGTFTGTLTGVAETLTGTLSGVAGVFSGAVSGTTGSFSAAAQGTTLTATTGGVKAATGVSTDGQTVPSTGFACGVVNAAPCTFKAANGATTTEGYVFDTGTACAGVRDPLMNYRVNGSQEALVQCNGAIVAGNPAGSTYGAGVLATVTGAGVGVVNFGSGVGAQSFDYGSTTSGWFTASAPLESISTIVAGSGTAPTTAAGDVAASRSTTTGAIEIGGSSNSCMMDYNVSHGNGLTMNCPLNMPTTSAGSTSCTLASTTSCSATASVGTPFCTASLQHTGGVTFTQAIPLSVAVSGGTLTVTVPFSAAQTGTATVIYNCF